MEGARDSESEMDLLTRPDGTTIRFAIRGSGTVPVLLLALGGSESAVEK